MTASGKATGQRKFALAYCAGAMVDTLFCESLVRLFRDTAIRQRIGAYISCQSGPHISLARDYLVRQFLETKHQWLLFVDSDMVFTPDDVRDLLAAGAAGKQVIAGTYVGHMLVGQSKVEAVRLEDGLKPLDIAELTGEVIPVDFVGAGFLLVHREVFEALADGPAGEPLPWFEELILTDVPGVGDGLPLGEDWGFCSRVAEAGYQVWLHTGVQVGHSKSGSRCGRRNIRRHEC